MRSHRAGRVAIRVTAGMATVSSSVCAHYAHASWGDPDDSQESSRLTANPRAIVETAAACPDRLRTRLPSDARACLVTRIAPATCPVLSRLLTTGSRITARFCWRVRLGCECDLPCVISVPSSRRRSACSQPPVPAPATAQRATSPQPPAPTRRSEPPSPCSCIDNLSIPAQIAAAAASIAARSAST